MAVGLVVVGPDKLPDLARSLAKGINELKKSMNSLKENIDKETEPWKETIQPALLEEIEKREENDSHPPPASGSEETYRTENAAADDDAAVVSHTAESTALSPEEEAVDASLQAQEEHGNDMDDDFDDDDEYDEDRKSLLDGEGHADGDAGEENTVTKENKTPHKEGGEENRGVKAVEDPTNGR